MATVLQEATEQVVRAERQVTCKNCGNDFTGSFCNQCGQKEAHRITFHHVVHELIHVFLHADKGIFPFIARITHSPGTMAAEFLAGKRKMFNPFQYLILNVGLIIFIMHQAHFFDSVEVYNAANNPVQSPLLQKAMVDFNKVIKQFTNLFTFLSLPIVALAALLQYRRRGHNFAEHLTVLIFSMAQVNTINVVLLVIQALSGTIGTYSTAGISISLIILSLTLTYRQLYHIHPLKALFKAVIIQVISLSFQLLLAVVGMIAYVLYLKSKM